MIRTTALLAALLACGCYPKLGTTFPQAEKERALNAWVDGGHKLGTWCESFLRDVRLVVAEPKQFEEMCRYPLCVAADRKSGCADACSEIYGVSVVVGAEFNLPGHRAHEMLHLIQWCAEKVSDPEHKDQTVWGRPDGMLGKLGG